MSKIEENQVIKDFKRTRVLCNVTKMDSNGSRVGSNNLLNLYVPRPKTEKDAITSRLKLIQEHKIFSADEIQKFLHEFPKNKVSQHQIKEMEKAVLSDQVIPDELEEIITFAADIQIHNERLEDDQIAERFSRSFIQREITPEQIIAERKNMVKSGSILLSKYGEKIRAKLAFLELIAVALPERIVHELILISPTYLASERINFWITKNQYNALSGNNSEKKNAILNLKKICGSIMLDKRTNKVRKYDYWNVENIYRKLIKEIKQARRCWNHKNLHIKNDYRKIFPMIAKGYSLDEVLKNHFLSNQITPSELALDVLIKRGDIDDAKAFRDFQVYVKKLKDKHHWNDDLELRLSDYWQIPSKAPSQLYYYDPFRVLEKITY